MFSSINVHNRLQELDIPHELFKLPERVSSLEQAAAAVGLEQHQLARVEAYRLDGEPALVIIPADRKVDIEKLKALTGASQAVALHPDELSSLSGYACGFIPPIALKTDMPVYIDYFTLREDVVYTGSGETTAILKIRSYDLVRATAAETVDVVAEPEPDI